MRQPGTERDELIKVARHCRLFIGERRGYRNNEEMERDDICKRINALLPQNRELSPPTGVDNRELTEPA
jgi:hypothetical protein